MSELTQSVFEIYPKRPRAALLMSGSGTNAEAILSDDELRDRYDFALIASDNDQSNALDIGSRYSIPARINQQDRLSDIVEREDYFNHLGSLLTEHGVSVAIYAGFMKIATRQFCEAFPGVNVHPADLSIVDDNGMARYRGMKALHKMRDEQGIVRSTVHVVDTPVDSGSAISLSRYVVPPSNYSDEDVHTTLKPEEHFVYTSTLKLLGRGALAADKAPYDIQDIERMLND